MFYALDMTGNKIAPSPNTRAICACCGSEVIAKCGNIKLHHWAHKSLSDCDEWYEMTAWHLEWQKLFPIEYREVVMQKDETKHRADIKIGNLVIEFQHSSLSRGEVDERELFYGNGINKLIWIIDGTGDRTLEWNSFSQWFWKQLLYVMKEMEEKEQIFIVDSDNNIYFELEGFCVSDFAKTRGFSIARNCKKFPIGLVSNPKFPTFVDLGEYIACPLEQYAKDIKRTTYSKKWGHQRGDTVVSQNFLLVEKRQFVEALYHIPTDLNLGTFCSLKLCDQKGMNLRQKIVKL